MKITHHKDGGYSVYAEEPETIIHSSSDDVGEVKRFFMKCIEEAFDKEMIYCVNRQLSSK